MRRDRFVQSTQIIRMYQTSPDINAVIKFAIGITQDGFPLLAGFDPSALEVPVRVSIAREFSLDAMHAEQLDDQTVRKVEKLLHAAYQRRMFFPRPASSCLNSASPSPPNASRSLPANSLDFIPASWFPLYRGNSAQAQYILHIKQAAAFVGEKTGGTQTAQCIGHAAACLVADLDAFTVPQYMTV